MTDISDEIVEAVAKAIRNSRAKDDEGEFDRLGDLLGFSGENKTVTVSREAARAALAACGYAQMRSALIDCKAYIDDPRGCTEYGMTATMVSLAAGAALRVKT